MEKKQRKRGRPRTKLIKKDKGTKKLFDIKSIKETNKTDFTNLLVHLPIDISLIENNIGESYEVEYLNYNNILTNIEKDPQPFEENDNNNLVEEKIEYQKEIIELDEKVIVNNNNIDKKVYIIEKQENIKCWWCCHKYENQTYGIPLKKDKEMYLTKGYFCSLNCAKSYNNNENLDLKEKQNRNIMLEMLNKELLENEDNLEIEEAPPRETLKIFGGTLTIEEFRKNKKVMKLIYPPLITIIPYIEEITIEEKNNNIKINKNLIKNNLLKLFN